MNSMYTLTEQFNSLLVKGVAEKVAEHWRNEMCTDYKCILCKPIRQEIDRLDSIYTNRSMNLKI